MSTSGYSFKQIVEALSQALIKRRDRIVIGKAAQVVMKNDLHEDYFVSLLSTIEKRKFIERLQLSLQEEQADDGKSNSLLGK